MPLGIGFINSFCVESGVHCQDPNKTTYGSGEGDNVSRRDRTCACVLKLMLNMERGAPVLEHLQSFIPNFGRSRLEKTAGEN